MENQNSPFSVRKPDGWEQIVSWTPGSVCPPKEEVWRCLDEYLDNMKLENCDMNEEVVNYAFRRQPSSVRAQDFEIYDFEETKRPYSGHSDNTSRIYRKEIPISLKEVSTSQEKAFGFDCLWDRYVLQLHQDETVSYRFLNLEEDAVLTLSGVVNPNALLAFQDNRPIMLSIKEENGEKAQNASYTLIGTLKASMESLIVLKAEDTIEVERISVG